jgi:hypothetical protein
MMPILICTKARMSATSTDEGRSCNSWKLLYEIKQYLNPEPTNFTKESFYETHSAAAAADPADSCRSRNPELTATWFMAICKWRWHIEKVYFHAKKTCQTF